MKTHLVKAGVELTEDADIAVHIVVPTGFTPVPGKFNVLFTMYEAMTLPKDWIDPINKADLIVVPCEHNKRLFRKYTDLPIEVCPEGIDPEMFKFYQREFPKDRPFAYIWNGASNPRKGYEHLILAWQQFWKKYPDIHKNCILIMKTTQVTTPERVVRGAHVFIDTRDYSLENLITLYEFGHCFVFPTMGEGWGLTLHEAQATGIPCIYTPWSGVADFMPKECAFPLKFRMRTIKTVKTLPDGTQEPYHTAPAADADIKHICRRMVQVYSDYSRALQMGKQASDHVRTLTWDNAARVFIDIMSRYTAIAAEKHRERGAA